MLMLFLHSQQLRVLMVVLPEPALHKWCTLFCLPALSGSNSSHDLSIFQTALHTTQILWILWYAMWHCEHSNAELVPWNWCTSQSKLSMMWPLTSALQEFVHELFKCSWILQESSHLVEVVRGHHDIFGVPHDIDHLWQRDTKCLTQLGCAFDVKYGIR